MSRIKARLAAVAEKLGLNHTQLRRARHRYKAWHKRTYKARNQKLIAREAADRLRGEAQKYLAFGPNEDQARGEALLRKATRKDKEALHLAAREEKCRARKHYWLGRVKVLNVRIHKLEADQASLEAELKHLDHVTIKGNHAEGGTRHERLKAVALASAAACASGKRPNFYSQSGDWDVNHCITGERYDHRSDCSSWVTSVYRSAGLSDPNGSRYTGGYTGTLVANGKQINRSELRPGDLIIYGEGPGHHVEMYVGPGDKTIGHGSSPVDPGIVDLFGPGEYQRYFRYF